MYCLSSFCCVCLSINKDLLNLNKLDDDNIPIINKLIFIAFGHEKLELDVTKLICDTCLKDLRIAYTFKTTCLTSNELLIGYNSQLKYFTGSVGLNSNLEIAISDQERVLSDVNCREKVKIVPAKKYKPRPLSKQKKCVVKQEVEEIKRGSYQCKHCNEIFSTRMRRLIHFNKTHHKNLRKFKKTNINPVARLQCSMCEKSFISAKVLKCHIFKVHFNDSKRFCRHCNHTFTSRKGFIKHMKDRHNYNNFTCEICNTKYLKETNYKKHMTMHTENKILKQKKNKKQSNEAKRRKMITRYLVCNTCDEIFINSVQLRRHMLTHGKSSFSIDNTFENGPNDNDNEILRSILTHPPVYTNENLFEAAQNEVRMSSEFTDNIDIKLEPIVEIKEEIFDEEMPFNFNLEPEISVETFEEIQLDGNQPNPASRPDEDSSTSSEVEVNKYECNICNKQFTVKSFLNAHLLIHNNASGPNFECIQCKGTFTEKTEFAQHILSNTCMSLHPTKAFSCNICFKLFKYEFSLNQHLRTH